MENNWKNLRKRLRKTLRQVENETGISNSYLSRLENGKVKKPSFDIVTKLSAYYSQPMVKANHCPLCNSDNIKDISMYSDNGIFGPGYRVHKTFDAMICNDCGIIFRNVNTSSKE
jgi:transcriptional regulator with XRE-family HTH domain